MAAVSQQTQIVIYTHLSVLAAYSDTYSGLYIANWIMSNSIDSVRIGLLKIAGM